MADARADAGGRNTEISDWQQVAVGASTARRVQHSPRAMNAKDLCMHNGILSWLAPFYDDEDEGVALAVVSSAGLMRKHLGGLGGVGEPFSGSTQPRPYPPTTLHRG